MNAKLPLLFLEPNHLDQSQKHLDHMLGLTRAKDTILSDDFPVLQERQNLSIESPVEVTGVRDRKDLQCNLRASGLGSPFWVALGKLDSVFLQQQWQKLGSGWRD